MRLIDADNLVSVCEILADKGGDVRYWEQLIWMVNDMPTVDAEPVVRCKDCKHWLVDCFHKMDKGNWWCADGERKEKNDG